MDVKNGGRVIAGHVTINQNGLLEGNGRIVGDVTLNGGRIEPGNSPGTLTIDGDYTQVDGNLIIEIAGTGAGDFDILNILGTATFDSGTTIDLNFINGFAPSTGDIFDFLLADIFYSDMSLVDFAILGLEPGFLFDVDFTDTGTFGMIALNDGVSAVPVPAAVWLFGSGLIGLVGIARRKKAA